MQRFNINWTAKALVNQDVMRSLLPATNESDKLASEEVAPDDMGNAEQFEEENYIGGEKS